MKPQKPAVKSLLWLLIIALLISLLLTACSAPTQEPTSKLPSASPVPATATAASPSATPTSTTEPTATLTVTPSPSEPPPTATASMTTTPSETPTALPTETSTQAAGEAGSGISYPSGGYVSMYLIQEGTGGPICGDSAFPVSSGVEAKGDVASEVAGALKQLFSIKSEYVDGFLNSLYRTRLRVNNVKFNPDNGLITVDLQGTYKPTGDPCDNDRVKAQIWSTIRQYEEVKATNILLERVPFGDLLANEK